MTLLAKRARLREQCRRCVERDEMWTRWLLSNDHGCSACKITFDAGSWSKDLIMNHRRFDRDLVCPGCAERGYAPFKYKEHKCTKCLETFGIGCFECQDRMNSERQLTDLVCKDCITNLRCAKCKKKYVVKYWSKPELKQHKADTTYRLVCKTCRELGYHPNDLTTSTCMRCTSSFGAHRFNSIDEHNVKNPKIRKTHFL